MKKKIDLLNFVEQGGCSAKLSASELNKALAGLPKMKHKNLLVDIDTHDDAGVYKINDDYALVQTTDFFPPVCSDPYDFGQIAAVNALSDVYAMGGQVLTALNIVLFPSSLSLTILKEILIGGQDKVSEAGGILLGGHTITNDIPTYGLAVTGWVHPDKIITNANAKVGDVLILTKPIGTGVIISAKKNDLVSDDNYLAAVENMKLLNKRAAEIMMKYSVNSATDITGFGLLGHTLKMALGSNVSIRLYSKRVPVLVGVMELIDLGVIPGAGFRNLEYAEKDCFFSDTLDYNRKMLLADAQTSGGLLLSIAAAEADSLISDLKKAGEGCSVVGEVINKAEKFVYVE
jgi:selenide,water dikinase